MNYDVVKLDEGHMIIGARRYSIARTWHGVLQKLKESG